MSHSQSQTLQRLQKQASREDVENILLKFIQAADLDVKKAEMGIIYIDEIDKVSRKSENPSITRDVSGKVFSRRS
ncbi:MAG: hypothetical protein Ct9H90mP11_06710 [Acidimicrobiales bacterium]|nr:MAG: hypothetical protein Ct9H90mP11_06710 [Acidimicrobiales bacterium]